MEATNEQKKRYAHPFDGYFHADILLNGESITKWFRKKLPIEKDFDARMFNSDDYRKYDGVMYSMDGINSFWEIEGIVLSKNASWCNYKPLHNASHINSRYRRTLPNFSLLQYPSTFETIEENYSNFIDAINSLYEVLIACMDTTMLRNDPFEDSLENLFKHYKKCESSYFDYYLSTLRCANDIPYEQSVLDSVKRVYFENEKTFDMWPQHRLAWKWIRLNKLVTAYDDYSKKTGNTKIDCGEFVKYIDFDDELEKACIDKSIEPISKFLLNHLAQMINLLINKYASIAFVPEKRQFEWHTNDWKAALYLQLSCMLANNNRMYRICPICGMAFEVGGHAEKKYCDNETKATVRSYQRNMKELRNNK